MAKIPNSWQSFRAPVAAATGWREMKEWLQDLQDELPDRSVYVIRTVRPFSISYPNKASPVLYIGEGNFQQRFRDHMKTWIVGLAEHLADMKIDVRFMPVRVRNNLQAHRQVEADLLSAFGEIYGRLPLLNRQYETQSEREHVYEKGFWDVLHPGSGKGYHWGITPLASNSNYRRSLKGNYF